MLTSPITITVNAVAKAMNLVNQDNYASEYKLQEATDEWILKIRHTKDKANAQGQVYSRHVVDFTQRTYAVAGISPEKIRRCYTTFILLDGDSLTESYLAAGLSAWLTASANANMIKVLGWES